MIENKLKSKIRSFIFKFAKYPYKIKEEKPFLKCSRCFSQVTYYVVGNAGDTVLSQCVRKTISVLEGKSSWKLINLSDKVEQNTITKINTTSALICGGGGLFLPDTNGNNISGWQWAISKRQIDQIKVPIIIYSVGYNYFKGQEPSELFRDNLIHLIKKASFIGLRNLGSVRAVKNLVGQELAHKVVYQPCTTTIIRKVYGDKIPKKEENKTVAFNIAFDRAEMRYGKDKETILSKIAESAKLVEQRGYKIYYVMHCYSDSEFIPYLKAKGVDYQIKDLSRSYPYSCVKFYNQIDVVIGMRGHSQMIPFGVNCEIISLGSHDKMKWFLEDIDALDWYIDVTHSPSSLSQTIVDKFICIHEQETEKTKKHLLKKQEELFNITKNNWKFISKTIN